MTISEAVKTADDRERAADWAVALIPTVMMTVLYYRWSAVALMVTAVAGFLAITWLLARPVSLWSAVTMGLLTVLCLPATAPWWLSALMGALTALLFAVMPWPQQVAIAIHPALPVAVLARAVLPSVFAAYTVPMQFASVDGMTAATPLSLAQAGETLPEWWRLLFGVHAGAVGEGCAAALLLGFLVMALRRRVRLIAPGCLLLTVVLLSWVLYGSWTVALAMPLMGGCLLGIWLFADAAYAPRAALDQAIVGVIAGAVTVLLRRYSGWPEGVAFGVLTGQLAVPALPFVYRGSAACWRWFGQLLKKKK